MPRTALTPVTVDRDGVDLVASLAAANVDGHAVTANPKQFLAVKNASGGNVTVTLATPATVDGEEIAESTIVVADGETELITDFHGRIFRQTADANRVWVNFSAVASVTVGLFQLDT